MEAKEMIAAVGALEHQKIRIKELRLMHQAANEIKALWKHKGEQAKSYSHNGTYQTVERGIKCEGIDLHHKCNADEYGNGKKVEVKLHPQAVAMAFRADEDLFDRFMTQYIAALSTLTNQSEQQKETIVTNLKKHL